MPREMFVFDAYGTLFDVAGAARAVAQGHARVAPLWPALAEDWRRKQLEYSWLRTIMGAHADFAEVTADALDWALEARGLQDPVLRAALLQAFRHLPAFPEASGALESLRARGKRLAILSNGSPAMLAEAVASAGLGDQFEAVISVEGGRHLQTRRRRLCAGRGHHRRSACPGGLRLVQRLGRGRGRALRLCDGLGEPHRRPDGPPAPRPGPHHPRPDTSGVPGVTAFFTAGDGARLAYSDEGTGLPVLCLSGLTRTMADFDYALPALAGCRVIRMDYRGRGASEWTGAATYTVPMEAQDALALLAHLGVARAAILGTSRGGLIGMFLAAVARTGSWACA